MLDFLKDEKVSPLERTLIENTNEFIELIRDCPVKINNTLKENICWLLANSHRLKDDKRITDYKIIWLPFTLNEDKPSILTLYFSNSQNVIGFKISIQENKLFLKSRDNIEIRKFPFRAKNFEEYMELIKSFFFDFFA